jgi:hypothetical protein
MQVGSLSRQILWRLVPLLLTSLLVLWLSGGFPPTNWQLLAQVLLHPSAYRTTQGASLSEVLTILWVQSLLLLLVWLSLLVLILRALFDLPGRAVHSARPRSLSAGVALAASAISGGARSKPDPLKNPFENLARRTPQHGTITLGKPAATKNGAQGAGQMTERAATTSRGAAGSAPVRAAQAQSGPLDPFAVQPDLLDLFAGSDPLSAEPAPQFPEAQASSKATPPEFVFGNPFEGPLPEVFEYDTDLKQSLADLKERPQS